MPCSVVAGLAKLAAESMLKDDVMLVFFNVVGEPVVNCIRFSGRQNVKLSISDVARMVEMLSFHS